MKTVFKLTETDLQKLRKLAELGKMDSEIAKELNVTDGAIFYWRKKLGIKSKFTYDKISKMDKKQFEILFKQGLKDKEIAEKLGVKPITVFGYRKYHNIIREDYRFNKEVPLTQFQKEVLIGTVLGDSSLILSGKEASPKLVCMHGKMQKEYCEYKTSIFKSIGAKCTYAKRKTADKRTGIFYESYRLQTPANPALKQYYNSFYINGKKQFPLSLLKEFTAVSLAFMYMDDGSKINKTYQISTLCFDKESLNKFRMFLLKRFSLETSLFKNNTLYIKQSSSETFKTLILPYIIDSMKYKLHVS